MIDPNILELLESRKPNTMGTLNYSIIIDDIQQQSYCNKEQIRFTVNQINPSFEQIIKCQSNDIDILKNLLLSNNIELPQLNNITVNNIVEKTLTIDSTLNFNNTTSMFTSGFIGSISKEKNKPLPDTEIVKDITNQHIECAVFPLAKQVSIDFLNKYSEIPSITITVDENNKLYTTYSLEFKQDQNNNFIGVIITFNNLKRKKEYDDINMLIIGDKIDQTNED